MAELQVTTTPGLSWLNYRYQQYQSFMAELQVTTTSILVMVELQVATISTFVMVELQETATPGLSWLNVTIIQVEDILR